MHLLPGGVRPLQLPHQTYQDEARGQLHAGREEDQPVRSMSYLLSGLLQDFNQQTHQVSLSTEQFSHEYSQLSFVKVGFIIIYLQILASKQYKQ